MISLPHTPSFMEHHRGTTSLSEDQLRTAIAYCKARLADIEHAPEGSTHTKDRTRAASQLQEYQHRLALLHGHGCLTGRP